MNTGTTQNSSERLENLLIDQATVGLDEQQERELNDLMTRDSTRSRGPNSAGNGSGDSAADAHCENEYMETAALVQLGMLKLDADAASTNDTMSAELKARILAMAPQTERPAAVANLAEHRQRRDQHQPRQRGSVGLRDAGWAVAAALAAALVFVQPDAPVEPAAEAIAPSVAAVIDAAPDAVTVPWSGPRESGFENVTGEIVWSDSAQAGYMRFAGMPANDPSQSQYQLWIIDPERAAQPVDGGVFDVPAGQGEVIIPVTAKLAVEDPTLFAITLEQPGGVVVSAGPLLILADPASQS